MINLEEIEKLFDKPGFYRHNGFHVVDIALGESAILKADITEESLNPYGIVHGGLIFGLGDTAMGIVAKSTGRSAVTLSSNISYLKPSTGEYLIAKASMIKNGKTTCFLRCDFYDEKDQLTATMDGSYYYID